MLATLQTLCCDKAAAAALSPLSLVAAAPRGERAVVAARTLRHALDAAVGGVVQVSVQIGVDRLEVVEEGDGARLQRRLQAGDAVGVEARELGDELREDGDRCELRV